MPNEFSNADYKMAADKQPKEKTSVTVEPLGPVASQERPKQAHFRRGLDPIHTIK